MAPPEIYVEGESETKFRQWVTRQKENGALKVVAQTGHEGETWSESTDFYENPEGEIVLVWQETIGSGNEMILCSRKLTEELKLQGISITVKGSGE